MIELVAHCRERLLKEGHLSPLSIIRERDVHTFSRSLAMFLSIHLTSVIQPWRAKVRLNGWKGCPNDKRWSLTRGVREGS
jgi:hypothetical protein